MSCCFLTNLNNLEKKARERVYIRVFLRTACLVSRVLSDDEKNAEEKRPDHIPSIFPDIYPDPKNRAVFLIRRWRRRDGETERETDTAGGISCSEFNLIEQPVLCPTIIQMNISLALPWVRHFGNKIKCVVWMFGVVMPVQRFVRTIEDGGQV